MNSKQKNPDKTTSRPSLYQADPANAFSILDAATVAGPLKRSKAPFSQTTLAPSRWRWGLGAGVSGLLAGFTLFYPHQSIAPQIGPAPLTAPSTVVAQASPAIQNQPAVLEQLDAPSAGPQAGNPLQALTEPPPVNAVRPAAAGKVAAAKPKPAASDKPATKMAAAKAETVPARPQAGKASSDGDVDLLEAVLNRLPSPKERNGEKP